MMFEADDVSPFIGKKSNHPPFLQRSVSAPAIAEHVSEALLPKYAFDENPLDEESLYYNNIPSRLNPRIPIPKRANTQNDANDDGDYSDKFLEQRVAEIDNLEGSAGVGKKNSILASLIEPRSRTPLDLIQEDFPSTPSSVFSNRLLAGAADGIFSDDALISGAASVHQSNPPSRTTSTALLEEPASSAISRSMSGTLVNGSSTAHPTIEDVSLSLQKLNPFAEDVSKVVHSRSSTDILLNGSSGSSSGDVAGLLRSSVSQSSLSLPNPPQAPMHDLPRPPSPRAISAAYPGATTASLHGQDRLHGQPMNIAHHGLTVDHSALGGPSALYRQTANGAPQQLVPGAVQYIPVEGVPGAVVAAGPGGAVPQGQQPAYYVQQPVYLDANGQPVYYRVGPPGSQYQQDVVFTAPDGSPADPLHVSYIPYGGNGQPIPSPQGYWAGSQDGSHIPGQPVYLTGPGGQPVDGNGMMRRVVYNAIPQGQQPQYVMANGAPAGAAGRGRPYVIPGQVSGNQPVAVPGLNVQGMPHLRVVPGSGQELDNGLFQVTPRGESNSARLADGSRNNDRDRDRMDSARGDRDRDRDRRDDWDRRDNRGGRDRPRDRDDRDRDRRDDRRDDRDRDRRDDRRDDRDRDNRRGGDRDRYKSNSGSNPVRDPLVDEFRSTYGKSRQWGLCDLLGHVVAFCQDQHGSRFIQQRLEVCSDVDKQLIFDEIIPSAHLLMTDVFGNYVLQKLFEYGSPEQCETLAQLLTGQSVQLAMQMYGCRVVQKALEYVSTQRLIALVSEFESPPVLLRCVHDSNGNHVIQKCIEIVSKAAKEASTPELSDYLCSRIQFIIDAFKGRVKELSSHPYGCRVVQRILEHCSNPQKSVILEELRQCCAELVQDCYGNYVIQFVMQHGWEQDRAVLIKEVQAHLLDFSQHKFASNVVEKCLQYASKRDRDEMIWTIINVTFDLNSPVDAKTGHCVLESMVRDPYANYVVQKVIDVSDERQRAAIMRYVKENIVQLRRYTYGKHIIVRLEKITNEKF